MAQWESMTGMMGGTHGQRDTQCADLEPLAVLALEAVGRGEDPEAADQGAATPDKPGIWRHGE